MSASGGPLRVGVVVPVVGRRPHDSHRRVGGAPRRRHDARGEPAGGERDRGGPRAPGRACARPVDRAQRRSTPRPALRPHQPGGALRGRASPTKSARRWARRPAAARRRPQARRRPLGRHHIHVLPGRRHQPGLGPAAGRGVRGGRQRRRPLLGRGEQPDLRPALHAGPRARRLRARRRGRLQPERALHRRRRATRSSGPSSCWPGSPSCTSRIPSSARRGASS